MELKIADDGEVLLRGPEIMKGYRNMPEQTSDAIDSEGWLHTGDIGELDDDGYLKIVDRKKELIITAGGKNISPANLEAKLKAHPLIGTAAVIGDQRPFLTALIVLDPDVAPAWAAQQGIENASLEALAEDERLLNEIQGAVDDLNSQVSKVEGVKKFVVLHEDWLPGGDELTPDDEAEAQADRGEVRLADRRDVLEVARRSANLLTYALQMRAIERRPRGSAGRPARPCRDLRAHRGRRLVPVRDHRRDPAERAS